MVLYRKKLGSSWSASNATLELGAPVHDYAKVRFIHLLEQDSMSICYI